jgi:hypothetical protein
MSYSVSHGAIYPRSKYWYAIVATSLFLLFASMVVTKNFIGIVLLIVFLACYLFYSYILVPKPALLIIEDIWCTWDKQSYAREDFTSFWIEGDNTMNSNILHLQKSWKWEVLSMNLYDDTKIIQQLAKEISQYLPFENTQFSLVEKMMRFLKL